MIKSFLRFLIRIILTLILSCLVIFFCLIYYIGQTPSGLEKSIEFARYLAPSLQINEAKGTLFSGFSLKNISYNNAKIHINIDSLTVDWDPWKLFSTQLFIHHLSIDHLIIHNDGDTTNLSGILFSEDILKKIKDYAQHIQVNQISINHTDYSQHYQPPVCIANISLKQTLTQNIQYSATLLNGTITGNFYLSKKNLSNWSFEMEGKNINPNSTLKDWPSTLNFSLKGKGEKNKLELQVNNLSGRIRSQAISGQIDVLILKDQLQINDGKVTIADSEVSLQGYVNQNWNIHWNIHLPDLKTLSPEASGNFYGSGNISGPRYTPTINATVLANINVADKKINHLQGKMNLILKPDALSTFSLNATGVSIHNHSFDHVDFNIKEQTTVINKNYITTFNIFNNNQQYVNIILSLPTNINFVDYRTQPFTAKLTTNVQHIENFRQYLIDADNPRGTIKGSMDIHGTLDKPEASGVINITNASLTLPKLGIPLTNINLQIIGNQTKKIVYSGSFKATDGVAILQGTTDLSKSYFDTTLSIQGKNLQAVNLPEYKVFLSPDLKLHFENQHLSIDGKVVIPKAEITPTQFKDAITLPEETVFVGQPQTTAMSLLNSMPSMQITLSLGDQIHIHYQHLDAMLTGNILISKTQNSSTITTGELYTTKGTYEAYQKTLTIQNGRLLYTGSELTNPGLNITATRAVQTVQLETSQKTQIYTGSQQINVGVQVNGTLNNPKLSLFSNPATLDQADIFSYLVLGVPASQATAQSSQAILAAASALNIGDSSTSKFSGLVKTIQSGLGLSELNVESVQTFDPNADPTKPGSNISGNTSVVVGREIAPNLFVHYSIGLFNPVSILNLRYQFSKHWSIQTEASTIDTGGDLLYSIERN